MEFLNNSKTPKELYVHLIFPVRILIEFLINSWSSQIWLLCLLFTYLHTWGDEDAKNNQMKLHGWTDAFQMYFHSFYRKKKIKLGNRRIHTKSIYFVDLNQDFSHKMSILLRCDSNIFSALIGRMKLNFLTAELTQKQFTFFIRCV